MEERHVRDTLGLANSASLSVEREMNQGSVCNSEERILPRVTPRTFWRGRKTEC